MKRSVGYCLNMECSEHAKGVFLLNAGDTYYCAACRKPSRAEHEHGLSTGAGWPYREVRVDFDYEPVSQTYKAVAVVTDESLPTGATYSLRSPLIRTDKRALIVAEQLLARLNQERKPEDGSDNVPRGVEHLVSFDESRETLVGKLSQLRSTWLGSGLLATGAKR